MKKLFLPLLLAYALPCLGMQNNEPTRWRQSSAVNINRRFVDLALCADSSGLMTCSLEDNVLFWGTQDGHYLSDLPPLSEMVSSVAFSRTTELIATAFITGDIRIWRREGGGPTLHGCKGEVDVVTFSPDEKMVAACAREQIIRLWDTTTGVKLREFNASTGPQDHAEITCIVFSPDGAILAGGSSDHTITLWRVADGQFLRQLHGHTGMLSALTFSPDGALLASGAHDGTARLWSTEDGLEISRFDVCDESPIMVAFSPNGLHLATGADPKTGGPRTLGPIESPVKIWNIATDEQIRLRPSCYDGAAADCIVFKPDGTRLVAASCSGHIKTWEKA